LLLAFRTSQSYERWWEARTVWGAIVNDSRTFVRLIIQFMPAEDHKTVKDFAERQIIWTYALGESLRNCLFQKSSEYLNENQISAVNIPNAFWMLIPNSLKEIGFKGYRFSTNAAE
jgi:putative membrane protein